MTGLSTKDMTAVLNKHIGRSMPAELRGVGMSLDI